MSSLKVFDFTILKVLIIHQWQFLLSVYFQVWDLPWELGQSARSLIFHENRLKTSLAMGGTSWAPPSLLAGMLSSLFLCMQHLLWFHESSGPFLCRINCFALVFLESMSSSTMIPETKCAIDDPLWLRTLWSLILCILNSWVCVLTTFTMQRNF